MEASMEVNRKTSNNVVDPVNSIQLKVASNKKIYVVIFILNEKRHVD